MLVGGRTGCGAAFLDDAPGVHDRDVVRGLGHNAEVVGDDHDAHAELGLQPRDELEDLRLHRHVERRRRARRRSAPWVVGEGHRDHRRWRIPPENSCG
jgi:hypothetical protein